MSSPSFSSQEYVSHVGKEKNDFIFFEKDAQIVVLACNRSVQLPCRMTVDWLIASRLHRPFARPCSSYGIGS